MGSDPLWVEISPASQEVRESGQWFAELRRGTLSAAIQRLGWAALDREEASRVYRFESADPVRDRYNAAITGYRAALAEVRRLRPTPPEGT